MRFLVLSLIWLATDAAASRLFYLEESKKALVEVDLSHGTDIGKVAVPDLAFDPKPRLFLVNSRGQILMQQAPGSFWAWDGKQARTFQRELTEKDGVLLGEDGFFWYRNRFAREAGTSFCVPKFNLFFVTFSSNADTLVFSRNARPCECTTGMCDETCPVLLPAFPQPFVSARLLLAETVFAQTGKITVSRLLFTKGEKRWSVKRLNKDPERGLAASGEGRAPIVSESGTFLSPDGTWLARSIAEPTPHLELTKAIVVKGKKKELLRIPRSTPLGWLSDGSLLFFRQGRVVRRNVATRSDEVMGREFLLPDRIFLR